MHILLLGRNFTVLVANVLIDTFELFLELRVEFDLLGLLGVLGGWRLLLIVAYHNRCWGRLRSIGVSSGAAVDDRN